MPPPPAEFDFDKLIDLVKSIRLKTIDRGLGCLFVLFISKFLLIHYGQGWELQLWIICCIYKDQQYHYCGSAVDMLQEVATPDVSSASI